MTYPQAPKHPKKITQHGEVRVDNYHWLRDENWQDFIKGKLNFSNSEVERYLKTEADYAEQQMASTVGLQHELYDEILGRIKEDDDSYPFERNGYFYFQRTIKGKNYPVLLRKKESMQANEEVYFDVNKEAEGKSLYMLGGHSTNHSNTLLAYSYNLTGSMERTIKVRDLQTGEDFSWQADNSTGSFHWVDDEHIQFVERGPQARGQKVFLFNVHQGPKSKKLIFDKPKEYDDMFMGLSKTTDKKFHVLYLNSGSASRVYYKRKEETEFHFFAFGENDIDYSLDHSANTFYIRTNEGGANDYQIFSCTDSSVKRKNWNLFMREEKGKYIVDFSVYGQKMILMFKNNQMALDEVSILDIKTGDRTNVEMSDEAYSLNYMGAYDPLATRIRFYYQSCKQPPQIVDIDLDDGGIHVLRTKEIPNFEPDLYELKREFAEAHDGKKIPLTIMYKKGMEKDKKNKAFVYAYGSYGLGMPVFFSPSIFSLVDRGFVSVIAHIRGGDEKGYNWYLDGKKKNKLNTFKDYISSCEYLVENKYVKSGNIVANGGSAGGLLMGVIGNMRPDLFKCIIADVPFVDMINTISDDSLPLTPPEWEEWGNPIKNKDDYKYMMSYSPYDNIESKDYPSMLYNSGISDEQVTYWEPAKMVAKLRELKTDNNLLLLNIKMHAGHAGASKRYEAIKEKAYNYAFLLKSFNN